MHKPLSYLTKICKQFSSKATQATSSHEDHNVTTIADTSATTIVPTPITNCAATTSTSSPINSSYYSTSLYSTSNIHSHSLSSNANNSCCTSNSNGSYLCSSSSLDPREYSNSNQGYSSTSKSLCYNQGSSFETEFGYSSPAYSHNSNSNYHSNHYHNQVANISYSNSDSDAGIIIINDRANSMESYTNSNSIPAGSDAAIIINNDITNSMESHTYSNSIPAGSDAAIIINNDRANSLESHAHSNSIPADTAGRAGGMLINNDRANSMESHALSNSIPVGGDAGIIINNDRANSKESLAHSNSIYGGAGGMLINNDITNSMESHALSNSIQAGTAGDAGIIINNDRTNSMESHAYSNSLPAGTACSAGGILINTDRANSMESHAHSNNIPAGTACDAGGMLISNDRANAMESYAHSNSIPSGTAGDAGGMHLNNDRINSMESLAYSNSIPAGSNAGIIINNDRASSMDCHAHSNSLPAGCAGSMLINNDRASSMDCHAHSNSLPAGCAGSMLINNDRTNSMESYAHSNSLPAGSDAAIIINNDITNSMESHAHSNSIPAGSDAAIIINNDRANSMECHAYSNSIPAGSDAGGMLINNDSANSMESYAYSNSIPAGSDAGIISNNDRANSMESPAHSNSIPAGISDTAGGAGSACGTGATAYATGVASNAIDGGKSCDGAGAIKAGNHNNDAQTLAGNHKLGTNNDCSSPLNDDYDHMMAPTVGSYQQDHVEGARSFNGVGGTLLNNSCDHYASDNTQRADSDNSHNGVHSLGRTTFAYAKDKYGAITKVDTKATDEILSNKEDELNDIQKSTCSSGPFSPAQRADLQAQCPITQSSLWQQVVGQHGQAKLGPGEVMLPELDPMHAGNHSYQLIHSLYNIANEGYLRFDAVSEGELIRANQGEISTLLRRVDGSAEELNCYLIPLIKAMVRCCSIAPASMYHHHDDIGGLIRHNLQIANDCIEDYRNFAHAKVTVANTIASLTEQRKVKKQAEAAYLANIQKQADLENKVKSSYDKFQESLGLIDDELNDGLNTDLDLEVLNTNSSSEQKYAALAKTMGLMIEQSFADGPIENLATIFDDDHQSPSGQSTSNGISTGAGAGTNTAATNSDSTATGVASSAIAGIASSGLSGAGDDNCDTTLAISKLKQVQNNPSSLFNGDQAIMDNWDSLNLLQRAKAFGLLTYVEDEQIAQLTSAYSGSNTNSDVALEAGEDPYLVGLGANLIGATSTAEAYEREMGNIKRSLFEDAFVKKICDLNLSQGSLNDYNSTVTKQRKDTFSGLINQIRMEALNNNIGRFDRYQLDLIVQLSLIFFSFAHDLGKLIHDMEIFNDRGERYNPHLETLANFAEQTQTKYLYLRYIGSRSKEEHSHTSSMFSGVRLLSSMCPDLVALIYQVFNLDAVLANKSHPINLFVASHDRINSAQITKTSNMYLKNFAAQMVIELVKSRLRADALAQMQIARIQILAQEQGIDLSSDFDLSPSGHNLNRSKAKAQAAQSCDFDNLWQEITPKAPTMQSSPSLSYGHGSSDDKSCSKTNDDQPSPNYNQGMSLCKEQGTNANDSNSLASSLHLNHAQGPAHSLKPDLSDLNGTQILQELLDANKQDHSQNNHSPIHNSVRSFREQMKEDGSFAYSGNDSNALNGEHLYKFNAQKQNELLKNKRIKDLQKEQYHWAVRIFKSARRSLSVNELGSDLYVEGNTVLLEQGSRALSTLNMAYQNYCYGHLSEQFSSCKSDFKTHLQVQKLSETYMSHKEYSWFAIAVGDDLVIVKGIDLRLCNCDFGSDVAIINLGVSNPLIEELTLDLANYILYNIRQS